MCDVVLLPVEKDGALAYYELDLTLSETDVVVAPSEPISIVGFPFGTVVRKPIVLEELLKLVP